MSRTSLKRAVVSRLTSISLRAKRSVMSRTVLRRCALFSIFAGALFVTADHAAPFTTPGGHYYVIHDDAMIMLRVAHNIARGIGPYFNPDERVAATTSLCWPYALSPLWRFRALPDAVLTVSMLSLGITAAILGLLAVGAADEVCFGIAALALVALPPFHAYAGSGFESIPEAFFVTAAFLVLIGRLAIPERWRTDAALVLLGGAFLMRPDAAPIIAVVSVLALWQRRWLGLSAAAFCVLVYVGLMLHFYGSIFPNTYYLKVDPGLGAVLMGLHYLLRSVYDAGVPVAVAFLVFHAARRWRATELAYATVIAAMAVQCVYIIDVSGDVFRYGRFFLLIMPTAVLLSAEAIGRSVEIDGWQAASAAVLILVVPLTLLTYVTDSSRDASGPLYGVLSIHNLDPQMGNVALAEIIRRHIQPSDGEIGIFWAGALPYYLPEYRFRDVLGKADAKIAHESVKWGPPGHNKWDFTYVLTDRRPVLIPYFEMSDSQAREMLNRHENYAYYAAFQENPLTRACYTYLSPRTLGVDFPMGLMVRDDLVARFRNWRQ